MPKTIAFSSIKGGVGKSSLAILLARYLARSEKKVLMVDADIQNSTTFYCAGGGEELEGKNLAQAILNHDLASQILTTSNAETGLPKGAPAIHLVPSSLSLAKLRTTPPSTLRRLIEPIKNNYDFIILDSSGNYDNFTLNCIDAADVVAIPFGMSQFDIKATMFLMQEAAVELDTKTVTDKFFPIANRVSVYYTPSIQSNTPVRSSEYLEVATKMFAPVQIAPYYIHQTSMIPRAIDTLETITLSQRKIRLHTALAGAFHHLTGVSAPEAI